MWVHQEHVKCVCVCAHVCACVCVQETTIPRSTHDPQASQAEACKNDRFIESNTRQIKSRRQHAEWNGTEATETIIEYD